MVNPINFGGRLAVFCLLFFVASAQADAESAAADAGADEGAGFSVYSSQVGENLVLAGELDLDALRAAHDGGILIVDLRTEKEGASEEAAAAESLGLSYTNIPVSSAEIDSAQVSALQQALDGAAADDLVVVHCRSGNRAGLLWGAAQLEAGVPIAEVHRSVSGIVTMEPISQGLEAYAKRLDAGQ